MTIKVDKIESIKYYGKKTYKLNEFVAQKKYVMEKKPHYWGHEIEPNLQKKETLKVNKT